MYMEKSWLNLILIVYILIHSSDSKLVISLHLSSIQSRGNPLLRFDFSHLLNTVVPIQVKSVLSNFFSFLFDYWFCLLFYARTLELIQHSHRNGSMFSCVNIANWCLGCLFIKLHFSLILMSDKLNNTIYRRILSYYLNIYKLFKN